MSLSWHFFWAFLVVPVVKNAPYPSTRSQSVFLGPILKECDLMPFLASKEYPKGSIPLTYEDFSRQVTFNKYSSLIYKPHVQFTDFIPKKGIPAVSGPQPLFLGPIKDVAFGFSDFSDYLYEGNFSDLKKIASREDLASFMDFKVLLTKKGEVKAIKKIVGSGDPALDLCVMLKLKKAIFKSYLTQQEGWLNVRFKIK